MILHHSGERETYDGTQLHSLWAYRTFGVQGDSLVTFRGACEVNRDRMVDLEDLRQGARIAGPDMLHFIVEHFDMDLEKGVLRQRLLAVRAAEELRRLSGRSVDRQGDDLFVGDGKLSISIATLTPVSTKIHFAVNLLPATDVGVKTAGLEELGVETEVFRKALSEGYNGELADVVDARTRVRGVE